MKTTRICIYPKDIQRITGRTERFGRNLLAKIREHFDKESYQFVSIDEFAEYTGLDKEEIQKRIDG
ncbi:MAG TPA: hypothetical protein VFM65_11870 [Flavobacteriaceae bacterium]|nr:hypothetical protein [Flavobacteriaceae bacterium]